MHALSSSQAGAQPMRAGLLTTYYTIKKAQTHIIQSQNLESKLRSTMQMQIATAHARLAVMMFEDIMNA